MSSNAARSDHVYIAIDMKSFYASVECVFRHLDPLKANLLVADPSRSDQTICLAVSPALKAIGVPSRPRLFEAKQAIRKYEKQHRTRVQYITAVPRMAEYERISAQIYGVYLKYVASEDIHVYSIDEVFIDCTPYLHLYAAALPPPADEQPAPGRSVNPADTDAQPAPGRSVNPADTDAQPASGRSVNPADADALPASDKSAPSKAAAALPADAGMHPAHTMAMTIIRDVLRTTGITATVGIGTNLYLAKIAMDIVAKKAPPDKDGVRIAELNEQSYCCLLWNHRPLTDFWHIGFGKANRLYKNHMYTMGDIAERSLFDEEWFYREFGIDGEILVDHAWGIEPVTMRDIKSYRSSDHSISNGQVLPKPYEYDKARVAFMEMIEILCADLYKKNAVCKGVTWWVSYDYKSLEHCPEFEGPVVLDFYGRWHPKHSSGTVRLYTPSNSVSTIREKVLEQFDRKTDHRLLYRRLGVSAISVRKDIGIIQLDLFTDYEKLEKEKRIQEAMLEIRRQFGKNAVLKGMNFLD